MPQAIKSRLGYILAFLFIGGMTLVSHLTGEKEIFFPEMLALAAGGWAAEEQPWRASRPVMWLLMSLSAGMGILLVGYFPGPVFCKASVAFLFVALCLHLFGSTLYPMISACILPILMGVDSPVYPLSVSVMTGLLVLGQWMLEKAGLRKANPPAEKERFTGAALRRAGGFWGRLLLVFVPLSFAALALGMPFFIAPPLLVAFAELAHPAGRLRQHPVKTLLLLIGGGVLGAGLRLAAFYMGLPVLWPAGLAAAGMLLLFRLTRFILPPAGAMALLPMLLEPAVLPFYPLQTAAGCLLFFGMSLLLFPNKSRPVPWAAVTREV